MQSDIKINGLMIASPIINLFLCAILGISGEYPGVLVIIMSLFALLSLMGLVVCHQTQGEHGSIMVTIGCALFVPIGLIGIFGVKKYKDEISRRNLESRLTTQPGESQ